MNKFKKIAFLFPGQGAQYVGMGKDFIEQFPIARDTFEEADEILKRKLSKVVLEGPEDVLTETRNSQVGIFVTSVAILRVLRAMFPEIAPTYCSGLSLGEYTALHASERISFADALALIQFRGQSMNDACKTTQGTMSVVLGLSSDDVESSVKEVNLPNDLWVANFNCPGQIVLSGTKRGIEAGTAAALARGAKRVLPLQVHGAFHSGLMKSAQEQLANYFRDVSLKDSRTELVMNVVGHSVKDLVQIKNNLILQTTSPVRWEQGIRYMVSKEVDLYLEMGCGKTLAGFNKRINGTTSTVSVETITDLDALEKVIR